MPEKPEAPYTYAGAGVDIARGNALVEAIRGAAAATARPGAEARLGGFGALFDLKATGLRDPVLVATTDGVGTKLKLAIETGKHGTVGLDLVAMCVNDLVVQGAEPLFFLDYFATGALDVAVAAEVVKGIAAGCKDAGCALVGGETAEMPGVYAPGDYDLAGFAVGAVERDRILPRADVVPGDVILGVASSGLHSNGFSLVRRLIADRSLALGAPPPFVSEHASLGEALLAPTRLYVRSALAACRTGRVKAMAHITGGGLTENVPRVLPPGVVAEIDLARLKPQPVFGFFRKLGRIEEAEMLRTFNCGVGLVVIAGAGDASAVTKALANEGETVAAIGVIREGRAQAPAETRYRGVLPS